MESLTNNMERNFKEIRATSHEFRDNFKEIKENFKVVG
jgi:hypothetical protein